MPSGGARAHSGPPPNPQSRRQTGSQASTWTDLPAEGRKGRAPKWPLGAPTAREVQVWGDIWKTPHAVVWERMAWFHDVAMYVRLLVSAEAGEVKAATEARQWSDRLGLNPAAMMRNRWRIVSDEVTERRSSQRRKQAPKRRLKVADDAVAGG